LSRRRRTRIGLDDGVLTLSMPSPSNVTAVAYGAAFLLATIAMGAVLTVYSLVVAPGRIPFLLLAGMVVVPLQLYVAWLWVWPALGRQRMRLDSRGLEVTSTVLGVRLRRRRFEPAALCTLRVETGKLRLVAVPSGSPFVSRALVLGAAGEDPIAVTADLSAEEAEQLLQLVRRRVPIAGTALACAGESPPADIQV
jgi:hypothetical protein